MRVNPGGSFDKQVLEALSNNLSFHDNFKGGFVDITTPNPAGTELTVQHGLGYVPTGFIIVLKEGAGDVYASNVSSWDGEFLYIKSDTADLDIRIFIF